MTPSTEDLLAQKKLPPRPTEISEDYEVEILEQRFQAAGQSSGLSDISPASSRGSSIDIDRTNDDADPSKSQITPLGSGTSTPGSLSSNLRMLHHNLETRLQPFWSSALGARAVRVSIFASPPDMKSRQVSGTEDGDHRYITSEEITTAPDGSFQNKLRIKWEDLCVHPLAVHMAFDESVHEYDFYATAEILPIPESPQSSASSLSADHEKHQYGYTQYKQRPTEGITQQPQSRSRLSPYSASPAPQPPPIAHPKTTLRISLTHSPIRVISDIDDTVKLSNVLGGARAVFHAVFVKDLKDSTIPGMGEWYTQMWQHGVRFHYVVSQLFCCCRLWSSKGVNATKLTVEWSI